MKRGLDAGGNGKAEGPNGNEVPKKHRYSLFDSRTFVAPVHTPFTSSDEINYDAIPLLAKQMHTYGFNTVMIAGSNGESYALSCEERKKVLEAWMQTEEIRTKKLKIIAHISCQSLKESKDLAVHAAGLGVDSICYMVSSVGWWKPKTENQSADLLVEVANSVPEAKVLYYHFPGLIGLDQKVAPILSRAKKMAPNVIGCKFTHKDDDDFRECISLGFDMICGNGDTWLIESIQMGGAGCFSTTSMGGASKFLLGVWENYEKDYETAKKMQNLSAHCFNVPYSHPNGFMATTKMLVRHMTKIQLGRVRAPLSSTEADPEVIGNFEKAMSATVDTKLETLKFPF